MASPWANSKNVKIVDSDTGDVVSTRSGSAVRGSTARSVSTPAAPVSASDRVKTSGATTGNTRSDIRKVPTSMAEDDGRVVTTKDGETVQLVSVGYNKIDHDLMRRDTSKAGGTAQKNGYTVYYDDLGYATKAVRNKAPGYTYVDGQKVYGDDGGIRDSGGASGYAGYAGSAGSGARGAVYGRDYTPSAAYTPAAYQEPETVDLSAQKAEARRSARAQKVDHVDPAAYRDRLDAWLDQARQQAENTVDYAVDRSAAALNRAQEDAQAGFDDQTARVNRDEALARDNHALYAESRGDRGGIGAAQYDEIANTAARNRQTIAAARQKLSTDTARQIEDLRLQGEFEKADAVLDLTQQYLTRLTEIEQWADQTNLGVDRFNAEVEQWLAEYLTRLGQIERSADQWERQFALTQRQYNDQLAQFSAQWEQKQREYADSLAREEAERAQWEREFAARQQQYADTLAQRQAEWDREAERYADTRADAQRKWDLTQRQYDDSRADAAAARAETERKTLAGAAQALLNAGVVPGDQRYLDALSLTREDAERLVSAAAAARSTRSSSSTAARSTRSSSASRSSSSAAGGATAAESGIVETMLGCGDDARAYEYLYALKYSDAKTRKLEELYEAAKSAAARAAAPSDGFARTEERIRALAAANASRGALFRELTEARASDRITSGEYQLLQEKYLH